jgi:hypothetical protein
MKLALALLLLVTGCAKPQTVAAPQKIVIQEKSPAPVAVLPVDHLKPGEMDFEIAPRAKAAPALEEKVKIDPACHPGLTTKGSRARLIGVGHVEQ